MVPIPLINCLNDAHGQGVIEILRVLEAFAENVSYVADQIVNNNVIIEGLIKCLNVQDYNIRFGVIYLLKKIMAKDPKDIEEVMSYVKRHVYNNVSETAKLLFGNDYRKFFARSADCNLLQRNAAFADSHI